jgi:hypothetical protein
MGDDHDIAIAEEHSAPVSVVSGRKGDVPAEDVVVFNCESSALVCSAECAFVVGASDGYLENNAASLARRADDVALIIHGYV